MDLELPRLDLLPPGLLLDLLGELLGVDSTVATASPVITTSLLLPATANLSRATALVQAMAKDTTKPPTRVRVRRKHRDMASNTGVDMVHPLLTPISLDTDSPPEHRGVTLPTRHPSHPGTDEPRSFAYPM